MNWLKISLLTTLGLFILVFVVILSVFTTNTGLRSALSITSHFVPEFDTGQVTGSIFQGFSIEDLSFQNELFQMKVRSLSGKAWLNRRTALIIPRLEIINPRVKIKDANNEPQPTPPDNSQIELPIPIDLQTLIISNADLDILGTQIKWSDLQISAYMQGSELKINPSHIEHISVDIAKSNSDEIAVTATTDPVSISPIALTLHEITLPLNIDITRFDIIDCILNYGEEQVFDRISLSGTTKDSQVTLTQFEIESALVDMNLKADMIMANSYPLIIEMHADCKQGPLEQHQFSLSATGSLANLKLLATLKGIMDANLTGDIELTKPNMPFDIKLLSKTLPWPISNKPDYQLSNSIMTLKGNLSDYELELSSIAAGQVIPESKITLNASGNLEQIKIDDLLLNTLSGTIEANGVANWSKGLQLTGHLNMKNIDPGIKWPVAKGDLTGKIDVSAAQNKTNEWHINVSPLSVGGTLSEQPLWIDGKLNAYVMSNTDPRFNIDHLIFSHGNNKINISGSLEQTWQLKADIDFPSIEKTWPSIAGRIHGQIDITGKKSAPNALVDINISNLIAGNQLSTEQIKLSGHVSPSNDNQSNLNLTVDQMEVGTLQLNSIQMSLTGIPAQHKLNATIEGKPISWTLNLKGHLDEYYQWSGSLVSSQGLLNDNPFVLQEPVNLVLSEKEMSISAHCWKQDKGSLCLLDKADFGTNGQMNIKIADMNIGNLSKPFLPIDSNLTAVLNAQMSASWLKHKMPKINANIQLAPGSFQQEIASTPFSIAWQQCSLTMKHHNKRIDSQLIIDLINNGRIEGKLSLDNQAANNAIAGHINIQKIQLHPLQPLLSDYTDFNGLVESQIKIDGTVEEPVLTGAITIDDIIATGRDAPLLIEKGQLTVNFNRQHANINGTLDNDGKPLIVEGNVEWQQQTHWQMAINIHGDNLKIQKKPELAAKFNPNLKIKITPSMAEINGKVMIPWARIIIKGLPPSAIKVSDDEVIVDNQLKPINTKESTLFDVKSDVLIDIGNDVKMEALGLKANLTGKLFIRFKDATPQLFGEMYIKEGTYRAFAQSLVIRKGRLIFNGPVDQPYLFVEAIRDPKSIQDEVIAGIKVTGPANKPNVEVFSEPPMAQQNILSYILTGKNIDQDLDANSAMTIMLIGMGLAQSNQMVGNIGESLGIKDLSLDAEGAGDESQVTVSGYIAPGLQVKYGVGVFQAIAEFTVRYELWKDLFIESVSSDEDTSVDLLYRFSF